MGSWLGRVAARYWMSVGDLSEEYGLELNINAPRAGWIALPMVPDATVGRLARLARLDKGRLLQIQTPNCVSATRRVQLYCARCLFVNPVDVAAPRWKRVWLDPDASTCEVHGTPLATIPRACCADAGTSISSSRWWDDSSSNGQEAIELACTSEISAQASDN